MIHLTDKQLPPERSRLSLLSLVESISNHRTHLLMLAYFVIRTLLVISCSALSFTLYAFLPDRFLFAVFNARFSNQTCSCTRHRRQKQNYDWSYVRLYGNMSDRLGQADQARCAHHGHRKHTSDRGRERGRGTT